MATTTEQPPALERPEQQSALPEPGEAREDLPPPRPAEITEPETLILCGPPPHQYIVHYRKSVLAGVFVMFILSTLAFRSYVGMLSLRPGALVKDAAQQLPPAESPINEPDSTPAAEDVGLEVAIVHTLEGIMMYWPSAGESPLPSEDGSDPENSTKLNSTEERMLDTLPLENPALPRSGARCCKPPLCCDLETSTACYRKCQGDYILALLSGAPVCPSLLPLEARLAACNATGGPGAHTQDGDCGVVGTLKTAWHTLLCLAPFWTASVVFLTVLLLMIAIRMLVSWLVLRFCPCGGDPRGEGRPGLLSRLKHSLDCYRRRLETARARASVQGAPEEAYETPEEKLLMQDIEDIPHLKLPEQTRLDLSSSAPESCRYYPVRSEGRTYARTPQLESCGHPEISENADDTPSRPAVSELKKRFESRRSRPFDEERLDHFQHVLSARRKSDGDDEGLEDDSLDPETYDQDMYEDYYDDDEYLQGDEDFDSSAESSGEEMEIKHMETVRADLARLRKEIEKQSSIGSQNSDPHRVGLEPPLRSN